MDSHVSWLRRRIFVSIATQTSATFAGAFVLLVALFGLGSDASLIVILPIAFVAAQVLAIGRVVHAVRNNPLGYHFLKGYVEAPFQYAIVDKPGNPHDEAGELLGFYPVIVIHDLVADPSPVLDLFQTADRVTTAAVSRASGAVSLYSQLANGTVLVTDSRVVIPHEGLAVNPAPGQHPSRLIAAHRQAIAADPGGAIAEPRALKLVSGALALEHAAYRELGPILGPFLNLEPHRRSFGRLVATLEPRPAPAPLAEPAAAS